MGMREYTQWCARYPWHVTKGTEVPPDCSCKYCRAGRVDVEQLRALQDTIHEFKQSQSTGGEK